MFSVKRRKRAALLVAAVVIGAAVTTAAWPARRLIGVDYVVTEHTLPLWIKAVDFVDRDLNLARTARAIVGGIEGDEARTFAVLRWTERTIHPQPDRLPIIDDHVWYVIVRGYGQADQHADVFTTLLVYAGLPAYWQLIGAKPRELPLSYVLVDGRWRVFDVAHRLVFRNRAGALATPEEIAQDASLVRNAAEGRAADLDGYLAYFKSFRPPVAPDVLRADLQMTGRRLAFETWKIIGREGRVWQIRPEPVRASQETTR